MKLPIKQFILHTTVLHMDVFLRLSYMSKIEKKKKFRTRLFQFTGCSRIHGPNWNVGKLHYKETLSV